MSVVEVFVTFYNHILSSVLGDYQERQYSFWNPSPAWSASFYDGKHRSCHRATLELYSTYLAGFNKRGAQCKQPNSRTLWISEFLTMRVNVLLSLSIILKSQGRGPALILPVTTISAFAACYLKNFFWLIFFNDNQHTHMHTPTKQSVKQYCLICYLSFFVWMMIWRSKVHLFLTKQRN